MKESKKFSETGLNGFHHVSYVLRSSFGAFKEALGISKGYHERLIFASVFDNAETELYLISVEFKDKLEVKVFNQFNHTRFFNQSQI